MEILKQPILLVLQNKLIKFIQCSVFSWCLALPAICTDHHIIMPDSECESKLDSAWFCPVYPCWTLPGSTSPFWIVRCACFLPVLILLPCGFVCVYVCSNTFAPCLPVFLWRYFCSVFVPVFCTCSDTFALFLCLTVSILLPVQMFGTFLLLKTRFCIRPHEPRKRTCTVLSASTEASSPSCFCGNPKNYTSKTASVQIPSHSSVHNLMWICT